MVDEIQKADGVTQDQAVSTPLIVTKSEAGETGKTIVLAIIIAMIVRIFAFEPFNIPSSSMVPNLLIGDYLFVSKYAYGYSTRSTIMDFIHLPGRAFFKEPKRGDVVVFKLPSDNSTDYIKRLIGLPGDKIQMKHGILYVNDRPMQRDKLAEPVEQEYVRPRHDVVDYVETFSDGNKHVIRKQGDENPYDTTEAFIVPERHYFFMGDNRDNSLDSRTTHVGFVPEENLVGRAEFLFFSQDENTSFLEFWNWPESVRWSRLFMKIK